MRLGRLAMLAQRGAAVWRQVRGPGGMLRSDEKHRGQKRDGERTAHLSISACT